MSWIDKILPSGVNKDDNATRASVPKGWKKCVKCDAILYKPDLNEMPRFARSAIIICGLVRAGVWNCVWIVTRRSYFQNSSRSIIKV